MDRRTVRRLSLALALAGAAASWAIHATGGYEFSIAGIVVRGHRVDRVLILSGVAYLIYLSSGGRRPWPSPHQINRAVRPGLAVFAGLAGAARRATTRIGTVVTIVCRPRLIVAILVTAVLADGFFYGARAVGGADSYGYVSQAYLWLEGTPVRSLEWAERVPWIDGPRTFEALGYVATGESLLVPLYSPGLPLLMALAALLLGAAGPFVISPLFGALAIALTFVIGRRVASTWAGVVGAWLLATSPVFLYMVAQPMSDVAVTAVWLLVWTLVCSRGRHAPAWGGAAAGVAIMIRPNLAPLAFVPAAWLAVAPRALPSDSFPAWRRALLFLGGALPGALVAFGANWAFYGSPLRSGYGRPGLLYAWTNVWPNVENYARWLNESQTPLVWAGVLALMMPLRALWPDRHNRVVIAALAVFSAMLVGQYPPVLCARRVVVPAFPPACAALRVRGCRAPCREGPAELVGRPYPGHCSDHRSRDPRHPAGGARVRV